MPKILTPYERDQQATDFKELARILEAHGSEWIIESVAEIEAEIRDCTCRAPFAGPTDINPPEVKRDRNCPVHGRDPDAERDRMIDNKLTGE